jgi:predicted unusual protein kinase regulating ubiquinone biosynthesis (AarF/ABC1/UbiB family)
VLIQKDKDGNKKNVQLVFYDFGQACTLQDDQASGILNVIEGIVDYDVDKCVSAFQTMGVLTDGADLDKVRKKVKNNFETGKLKVKQRGQRKLSESSNQPIPESMEQNSTEVRLANATSINVASSETSTKTNSDEDEINDAEIMSYFTLPAEYAFVARALSQMDGVGKNLDSEFDFISAAAPYLIEIKGSEKYLTDELTKYAQNVKKATLDWQKNLFRDLGFPPVKKI